MGIFLTACSVTEDPRALASLGFSLTYDGVRCQPYESFVPIGTDVEITLINNSDDDITWYLTFLPFSGDVREQNPENILAAVKATAQEVTKTTFKSPYLPGKYSSFCTEDNHLDKIALTYLLVVQPYEEE
ncbi:MAG TPA: hypothetical protein VK856_14075 [Anaerolineaceae bacterium]|nr:hypothetical protein [Anaerolineaceae bacterium]